MFSYPTILRVQVAKYVKVPMDNIHQKNILFSYPEQHFFRQQVAYVFDLNEIQSRKTIQSSLLLQKKQNMLSYLKFRRTALYALLTLGSLYQKDHKIHNNISFLNNLPDVSQDYSLTFWGADNELYASYHLKNNFNIVRILDKAYIYELLAVKAIGVGLPLYNNYIPLVALANDTFIVMIYDIINKTRYEIANYSIDFLEKQFSNYIKKLTGRDISDRIGYYRASYKILEPYRFTDVTANKSFEICSNLSLCKTVLYIGNRGINAYENYIIFEMEFEIRGKKLYYELSIPRGISLRSRGVAKTPAKQVIETQTMSISIPKVNYIQPNILYYQNDCAILKDFIYNDSYYILDLNKNTKHKISNKLGYRNATQFFVANNLIMIVYFASTKLSQERAAWHLMIYDTIERRFFNTLIDDWHEGATANLLSYYYIEKCQKVIFILGHVNDKSRDFYNIYQNRSIHTVSAITILDLSKLSNIADNDDIEKCKEMIKMPFFMEKYLKAKWNVDIFYVQADCTLDAESSMLYITAYVPDYKNPVITMAKNLCQNNAKFYNFDLEIPILRTYDLIKDREKPIYISSKALKSAQFPKYLHMYDLKGFYDFVNSKTVNTGLIFIAYPDFLIVDRYYNRTSQFYREFSEFYLTYPVLINSYLVGYYMSENAQPHSLAGIFVINDLTVMRLSL